MTSEVQTKDSTPAAPSASWLPYFVGIPLGLILFFAMPQGGYRLTASITPWLRMINIVLLAFHAVTLTPYFVSMVRAFARNEVTLKDVITAAVLLIGTVCISLANIFLWLVLAEPGPLLGATVVSILVVVAEVMCIRQYYLHGQIQKHAAAGNYQAALALLNQRLQSQNVSYWDLIAAGTFHLRLGHTEEGQQLVERGLEMSARNPIALTHVASAYYVQKRFDEGLQFTDEAMAAIGEQPLLLLNRCLFLVELDRVDEARSIWKQLKQQTDPAQLVPRDDRDGQLVFGRLLSFLDDSTAPDLSISSK